jgi:hypothetical protein
MGAASQIQNVPLAAIHFDGTVWPRECLDDERVEDFTELYREQGAEALPALELVPDGDVGYLIGDGVHRWMAAREAGLDEVRAVLVVPSNDIDPAAFAYLHALHRSAISSKPLTRSEKQAAIRCLITHWPEMSDREIARRVGVDHKTVGRVRRGDSAVERDPGYSPSPSPQSVAKRLFKAFEKAYEARGLGIADFFAGDRTGERLAAVLDDVYGELALERAQTFRSWIDQAISALEGEV